MNFDAQDMPTDHAVYRKFFSQDLSHGQRCWHKRPESRLPPDVVAVVSYV